MIRKALDPNFNSNLYKVMEDLNKCDNWDPNGSPSSGVLTSTIFSSMVQPILPITAPLNPAQGAVNRWKRAHPSRCTDSAQ